MKTDSSAVRWKGTGSANEIVPPRQQQLQPLAFSGYRNVISPRLLKLINRRRRGFRSIDTYLRLAGAGEKISAFRAERILLADLGRPERPPASRAGHANAGIAP